MKKKIIQLTFTILALFGIFFISGCDEFCGGSADEPEFEIFYNAGGTVNAVYAVKDGANLPPVSIIDKTNFYLPIDLNENSVTYIFETSQGNKSLQVFYETNANLESFDCGFRFNIENPRAGSTEGFNNVDITSSGGNFTEYQITLL